MVQEPKPQRRTPYKQNIDGKKPPGTVLRRLQTRPVQQKFLPVSRIALFPGDHPQQHRKKKQDNPIIDVQLTYTL